MAALHSHVLFTVLLVALLVRGGDCSRLTNSSATYYASSDGFGYPRGACGYAELGRNLSNGAVASVSRFLYRNGTGCGACYQVMCRNKHVCKGSGVNVVATSFDDSNGVDFVMSPYAFSRMASKGKDNQLLALGVVNIKYRRVACHYPGYNISFYMDKSSYNPYYLSLIFVYQGGEREVVTIEISLENKSEWKAMRRSHGGVWDMVSPPKGNLALRFQLSDEEWIYAPNFIPANWMPGDLYDSGVQFN